MTYPHPPPQAFPRPQAAEREIFEITVAAILGFRRDLAPGLCRNQVEHLAANSPYKRLYWAERCLALATKGLDMPWEDAPSTTGPHPMRQTINTGSPLHTHMPTHLIPGTPVRLFYVSNNVLVWDRGDWTEASNDLIEHVREDGIRILDSFQITYLPAPVTMRSAGSGMWLRRDPVSDELYHWWQGKWEWADKSLVEKLTAKAVPGFQIPGMTAGEILQPLKYEGDLAHTFGPLNTVRPNLILRVYGDRYLPDGEYLAHSASEMAHLTVWIGERWVPLQLSNPESVTRHPLPQKIRFIPTPLWDAPAPEVPDDLSLIGKVCFVFDAQALPLFGKVLHDSRGVTDFRVHAAFKVEDQGLDELTLARALDALLSTLDPEVWAPDITRVLKAMGCEEFTVETMTDVYALADAMMEEEDC